MKKIEIVGYQRANLGRTESQAIRAEGNVPCVLYGAGQEQVHFYAPAILFRQLLFTPDVYDVTLNIEGAEYRAILQETQFHPVSDALIHADFLTVSEKPVKVAVPVRLVGNAPGVQKGGKLVTRIRKLRVRGLVDSIPEYIDVDVSNLDLGKSIRVGQIPVSGIDMLEQASNPVASIEIPRALRGQVSAK